MSKVVIFLLIALAAALVACGNGQDSAEFSLHATAQPDPQRFEMSDNEAVFASPAAAPEAPVREVVAGMEAATVDRGGFDGDGQALQTAERMVISTASISLEVEAVEPAIKQAQAVVEGMDGFVENLSSSGGSNSGEQRANLTLRVPQDRFLPAVEAIENLGVVQDRNLGSEDVSERFIDLDARLKSSLREEQSLLSLLERTATVSEILAIERKLFRVRADVERFQGQLNFLKRRVNLATIHLSLFPPQGSGSEPPSAIVSIEVPEVGRGVDDIKGLVGSIGGSVDQVFLSLKNGQERADLSLRVFTEDFARTMAFLEDSGDVKSKELTEGKKGSDEEERPGVQPDARVQVSLIGENGSVSAARIVTVLVYIGGILLALVFLYGVFKAFRGGWFSSGSGGGRFR